MIERIFFLTDLKSLVREVLSKGKVTVAATKSRLFVEHIRAITSSLDDIPDDELRDCYRRFLVALKQTRGLCQIRYEEDHKYLSSSRFSKN